MAINYACQSYNSLRQLVVVDILPRSTYGAEFFSRYVDLMKKLQSVKPTSLRQADSFLAKYESNQLARASLLANLKVCRTGNREIFQYFCNLDTFSNYLDKFFAFPPICTGKRLPVGGEFPVTLVLGKQSVFLPRDPAIGGLSGEIDLFERTFFPGRVETIWIEGAGHFSHVEKRDDFYDKVTAALI